MIKVALTGNIASGKSLVESFFQEEGILTLDTDALTHNLLAKDSDVINSVNYLFEQAGYNVKDKSGKPDRKKIGKIAFKDPIKLKELEKIIHPKIKKAVDLFFQKNLNEKIIVVSVPLLYETDMQNMFDYVIFVTASKKIRLKRLQERNKLSEEEALNRIHIQKAPEEKEKMSDFVIDNSGKISETKNQFNNILNKISLQML